MLGATMSTDPEEMLPYILFETLYDPILFDPHNWVESMLPFRAGRRRKVRSALSQQRMALCLVRRQWRRVAAPLQRIAGQYRVLSGHNHPFNTALPISQLQCFTSINQLPP